MEKKDEEAQRDVYRSQRSCRWSRYRRRGRWYYCGWLSSQIFLNLQVYYPDNYYRTYMYECIVYLNCIIITMMVCTSLCAKINVDSFPAVPPDRVECNESLYLNDIVLFILFTVRLLLLPPQALCFPLGLGGAFHSFDASFRRRSLESSTNA